MSESPESNESAYQLRKGPSDEPKDTGWYKQWPYAFVANMGEKERIFYLPIAPQNLNIVTNFATNIIATLYSTVEEHSEVRYYDITIQGTTGICPKYINESAAGWSSEYSPGRASYSTSTILSDITGGFMRRTVALIQATKNAASDLLIERKHESGVFTDNNGYIAFHNFYRFLLRYKKYAADMQEKTETTPEPLVFLNYKDNNQYSCVVQRFVLERSAENPMLYNYSIQMRGYDLKTISSFGKSEETLTNTMETLGLSETKKSMAAKIAEKVRLAKNSINAARNLVGSVGR